MRRALAFCLLLAGCQLVNGSDDYSIDSATSTGTGFSLGSLSSGTGGTAGEAGQGGDQNDQNAGGQNAGGQNAGGQNAGAQNAGGGGGS